MHLSSLASENLKEYMLYAVKMSEWSSMEVGNLVLAINGRADSLFNYVFCRDGSLEESERSAKEVLNYLHKDGIDATWVMDSYMKTWRGLADKLRLFNPTSTRKVYKKIPKVSSFVRKHPNLVLDLVNTQEALVELDHLAAKIFCCKADDLIILLRGMTKKEPSRLRFFIAKLFNKVVGLCGMYVHENVVGMYSDGVLPEYRNMGIASEMVQRRMQIAVELFGCEHAVAQCVAQSVSLYERLGFKATGNMYLYPSPAA
ncbi:acetyltransferase family protein [Anaplasma phagocytophilum str. ApWI1]|uniref:Acetyltransferase, GNAT family n=5 Tax=Anaplasma phagocytophilum TaxID=948 RepID=Q2GJB1_ANAPZ|nr:acetyltransferase, GNAT family [Anaplasma phagocytophilum str. HZ]AGR78964.1 acetyltransferase [Anaplasma phagocytophilum str. HZ2]AGR80211.1 acetyltransferase [Anaplasma phagocytophilum str. JM]AGR81466.1 acetyltransferase [Anaplasma phagocytophilum str. Dog2]EOA61217.1 acetyltransferase [Anaplasma phagocytophilum str. HGE1]KJV59891.1 acetyltransferase family protein [Anaplasma phagocytophilum str. Webster]KJV82794.1 acetyltransferase family protein [Anaplasma phagocytophilum str. HGE2]K